mmetsp:Transcript_20991/g.49084  ORF Transcript_20991/g.49084 Transcript_20991/m.49084 type:complete len:83 (+) Transcript_20991:1538-1786(+)
MSVWQLVVLVMPRDSGASDLEGSVPSSVCVALSHMVIVEASVVATLLYRVVVVAIARLTLTSGYEERAEIGFSGEIRRPRPP